MSTIVKFKELLNKKNISFFLMVLPPVLFVLYAAQSIVTIRSLLSKSSSFHLDYANDLIQEFLRLDMALDLERLERCLVEDRKPCSESRWFFEPSQHRVFETPHLNAFLSVPLETESLHDNLDAFFNESQGLSALFQLRYGEPVYWFQILDSQGQSIYQSAPEYSPKAESKSYPMDRALKGYVIEIVYNSFGPKQLYSVARTKINFALIFFLFILAIISGVLFTRSIRQKLNLAKQKTFFVSTVSHEFKTPLAIMRLAAETLQSKRFRSKQDETKFQRILLNEMNRLDLLVQKILSFNKIEMGQVLFHHDKTDLKIILKTSLEAFQVQALADHVALEVDLCEEDCPIYGDPGLLRHAIDNILDNAFKYRGSSTRIQVSCRRIGQEAKLSVTDFGIGIAPEELPHIRKSFYRIHDPLLQGVRGSGLGLAISSFILKHSNATLTVTSELRKGSCFTLSFPLRTPS